MQLSQIEGRILHVINLSPRIVLILPAHCRAELIYPTNTEVICFSSSHKQTDSFVAQNTEKFI